MTVGQLIEMLGEYPRDAHVVIPTVDQGFIAVGQLTYSRMFRALLLVPDDELFTREQEKAIG